MFESLCPTSVLSSPRRTRPARYSIMFPTPDEIRRSLNGYGSGGSIHMKLQSAAQQKQLRYMHPYLSLWAGDRGDPAGPSTRSTDTTSEGQGSIVKQEAGRRRAAPHIKTYIRFSDASKMDRIDWAMTTSANLSTQAWGSAANANGEVRICSWEIGVIVWPALFAESDSVGQSDDDGRTQATMVPCFRTDLPSTDDSQRALSQESNHTASSTIVGFRMPYDLPLTPYGANDMPWCASAGHSEPDWLGQTWDV
jgi:tyrosyl-DNA phosphodiesterase-1